jgi:hypothetical protein
MSLLIDVRKITAVLLADGWHNVTPGTFNLDSFEFGVGDDCIHYGGNGGVCSTGFEFKDDNGDLIAGPLTAVLAVRRGNGWQPYRNPTDMSAYDEGI